MIAVYDKLIERRRDSVSQYAAADRHALADAERLADDVISPFCPSR